MPRKIGGDHVGGGLIKTAQRELPATIRDRYRSSFKKDKSRINDEFIAATGHDRPAWHQPAGPTSAACSYFGDTVPLTLARMGQIEWFTAAGELLPARSRRGILAGGGVPNYLLVGGSRCGVYVRPDSRQAPPSLVTAKLLCRQWLDVARPWLEDGRWNGSRCRVAGRDIR